MTDIENNMPKLNKHDHIYYFTCVGSIIFMLMSILVIIFSKNICSLCLCNNYYEPLNMNIHDFLKGEMNIFLFFVLIAVANIIFNNKIALTNTIFNNENNIYVYESITIVFLRIIIFTMVIIVITWFIIGGFIIFDANIHCIGSDIPVIYSIIIWLYSIFQMFILLI